MPSGTACCKKPCEDALPPGAQKMLPSLLRYLSKQPGCTKRKIIDTHFYMAAVYSHFTAKPIHLQLRGIDRALFLTLNWQVSYRMAISGAFPRTWVSALLGRGMNCVTLPGLYLQKYHLVLTGD